MKKLLSLTTMMALCITMISQTFQHLYGSDGMDLVSSIEQLPDQDYILGGVTSTSSSDDFDMFIFRTDGLGKIEWSISGGTAHNDFIESIDYSKGHGCIYATGISGPNMPEGANSIYIIKLTLQGEVLWVKEIQGDGLEYTKDIKCTTDGGFIVTGGTEIFSDTNSQDIMLLKGSPLGELQWSMVYGGAGEDGAVSTAQTNSGDYLTLGYSQGLGKNDVHNIIAFKTSENGELQNSIKLIGEEHQAPYDLTYDSENDCAYIVGDTDDSIFGQGDALISKINSDLSVQWSKAYGGNGTDHFTCVKTDSIGDIFIGGSTSSSGMGGLDAILLKLKSSGEEQEFNQLYGGDNKDVCLDLTVTPEIGVALVGYSRSLESSYTDGYFIKTDFRGHSACNEFTPSDEDFTAESINFQEAYNEDLQIVNVSVELSDSELELIDSGHSEITLCSYGDINPYLSDQIEIDDSYETFTDGIDFDFNEEEITKKKLKSISINSNKNLSIGQLENEAKIKRINIYDLSGRLLFFDSYQSDEVKIEINLSDIKMSSSIYLINLTFDNDEVSTYKLNVK